MKPTLIILAAGMGSRYGGMKQLEEVGPSGETIMDYSMYDALRGGFGRVVFVIRSDMEQVFRKTVGIRYESRLPVDYAFQRLDDLPSGFTPPLSRTKPWGTGQAVLAVADRIDGPFAVVNADDFYGEHSFAALGEYLTCDDESECPAYAMVGYRLRDTLAETGVVNRGCCRCDEDGWLVEIEEILNIECAGSDARYLDADGREQRLKGDQIVSMNTWGFRNGFLDLLRERFVKFLEKNAESEKAEFYLPFGVQELIQSGHARVKVLQTPDRWCGVTHKQDKPRVVQMIGELVAAGCYPQKLWD